MKIFEFEDGKIVSPAKVIINEVEYNVVPAVIEGKTPLSSYNLNRMQRNFVTHKYIVNTIEEIPENTNYEIPCFYKVGEDVLDIIYMGEKLVKDEHYKEVGETGTISNTIQFFDWGQSVPVDRTIEFIVRSKSVNVRCYKTRSNRIRYNQRWIRL